MPLAALAASQAKSFQLQPLPFGRLSYHSFPAPGVNENSLALPVRMVLTLPAHIHYRQRPGLQRRQNAPLYPVRSTDLPPYGRIHYTTAQQAAYFA